MKAKKIFIYFLVFLMVVVSTGVPAIVLAIDTTDKMIVFNPEVGNNSNLSNIVIPLNLSSGGKYKLTFKMRTPNNTVPIIGTMRTSGSGYAFSEIGNVNNSATPDANGYYCSYDAESFTFTAVFGIDRYGATTAGGANCFITIGNTERDGRIDTADHSVAFVFAEPTLYKLDDNGNETGGNQLPSINDTTVDFENVYNFSHNKGCTLNNALVNKWTFDTNALDSNLTNIPTDFFTTNYSGGLDSFFDIPKQVEPSTHMIVFNSGKSDNSDESNIVIPLNLSSDGKYKLTFKMRTPNNTVPIIGTMRTSGSGYAFSEIGNVNNSATPDANGYYCSYDAESFTFTAVFRLDRYGATTAGGANCFITIGNVERDGRIDSADYSATFAFGEPELYKLDNNGNKTGDNQLPIISDTTVDFENVYNFSHNKECTLNNAVVNKWILGTNAMKSYSTAVPTDFFTKNYSGDVDSFFDTTPPAEPSTHMIVFNPGEPDNLYASNIVIPLNLSSDGKYKLTFKMRSPNNTVPIIGSMRTSGSGYAFSEIGNVNNSATPDANGYYCSYDAESFTFTAVFRLDRYGATTAGGANCFITIGNIERDGRIDTSDYSTAFAFSDPTLYKLDDNGDETGSNQLPSINVTTVDLGNVYDFSHNKECGFNGAEVNKWAIDTKAMQSYCAEIPADFFSPQFSGDIWSYFYRPATDHLDKMIVFNPASDNVSQTVSNIVMPLNVPSSNKYKLTFKMRSFNGSLPIIGSIRTTGSGYAFSEVGNVNNSATPDAKGYYCSYDAESFTFTAVFRLDTYGATTAGGANCFITIGNAERDGRIDSVDYATAFAFANPELYLLDGDGNPTGNNLIPKINDLKLDLDNTYSFAHGKESGFKDAVVGKWAYDSNTLYSYSAEIPENFFTNDFTGDLEAFTEIPEQYYTSEPQAVYTKPDNTGTDFGQIFYLDPGGVYTYEGYFKGGIEMQVRYHRADKSYLYNASLGVVLDDNGKYSTTFVVPTEANGAVLTNGKVKMFIGFRDIVKDEGWAYGFNLYKNSDPKKTNLFVNSLFREDLKGWRSLNGNLAFSGDTEYIYDEKKIFPDSYELKSADELPEFSETDISKFFSKPKEALKEKYMLHVTPDSTNQYSYIGQWMEFEKDATYRFEVRYKTLTGTSFLPCLEVENAPLSTTWKGSYAGTVTQNKENYVLTYEFTLKNEKTLVNDKVRAKVTMYDSTGECEAYCTGFKMHKLDESGNPIGENMFVNPDFEYGLYGWRGTGMTLPEAEYDALRFTTDVSTHELLPYVEDIFIPDYTDRYFTDDKSWADVFKKSNGNDGTATVSGFVTYENGDFAKDIKLILTSDAVSTVTDEDGMFSFTDVNPGEQKLYVVTASGKKILAATFEVEGGLVYLFSANNPIMIERIEDTMPDIIEDDASLKDVGTIRGQFISIKGKPLAQQKLYLRGVCEVTTDENGLFEFTDVPAGEYEVYTVDSAGKETVLRKVNVLSGKSLKITLKEKVTENNNQLDTSVPKEKTGYTIYIIIASIAVLALATVSTVIILLRRKAIKAR